MRRSFPFSGLAVRTFTILGGLLLTASAQAHYREVEDLECRESYSRDCHAFRVNTQRIYELRMSIPKEPMAAGNCGPLIQQVTGQIRAAEALKGIATGTVTLEYDQKHSYSTSKEVTCSFIIRSNQQDVRLWVRRDHRMFWIGDDDIATCKANTIAMNQTPGRIGAILDYSFTVLQGAMCEVYSMTLEQDKVSVNADGKAVVEKALY